MKVYPNPTRSKAFVSLPAGKAKGRNLIIKNKAGDIIQKLMLDDDNLQLLPIDFSSEPNGLYSVSLEDGVEKISYEILNLSQN